MAATTLNFRVSDQHGKPLGSFTLELTSDPARTCLGGEWRKAIPRAADLAVPELSRWWKDEAEWPAYQITGRLLDVELNGGEVCDDYITVLAELRDADARGFLESSGLGGSTRLGIVTVSIAPALAPPNKSLERTRGE
jgi:hypothetical protein